MADCFTLPGPFSPRPRLAVAVSGGADSMALALLARDWAASRGGTVLGLIVDHGLRAGSAAEAAVVQERLLQLAVPAKILTLSGIAPGADSARRARHEALIDACRQAGLIHLLFGHHADDQVETLQIRVLAGSGGAGLAGMTALHEGYDLRRLRPLLACRAVALRQWLTDRGVAWIDDPSNSDQRAQRGRLRRLSRTHDGTALTQAAYQAGRRRATTERRAAAWLAEHAMIFPEGFALIPPGSPPEAALAALIQMISGAPYPPAPSQVANLATRLRSGSLRGASLGGVNVQPAGRLGDGWCLVREVAAMAPPVPAVAGAVWDRRFRLLTKPRHPGAVIGPLNAAAAQLRRHSHLPSVILRGLPAIWLHDMLVAAPHLGYPDRSAVEALRLQFCPARPAACAPWFDSPSGCEVFGAM